MIQFDNIYLNRKVLITGHTGFKGSWLAMWLKELGADIIGYALEPPTRPNHYDLLSLDITSIIGDIRDRKMLNEVMAKYQPEIVFHLAAQPLVRDSYDDPYTTFETNVLGTLNVFEACRQVGSVKAIINVTSDKCYENKEWVWGYRENDPMGGYDPYSASKGCAELLTSSYRNSYYNVNDYGVKHNTLLASVRAGNVIGGGDWAKDRLIPDIMRAAEKGATAEIRNPLAIRPWQHVLDPLSGYLMLAWKLSSEKDNYAESWNFGPVEQADLTVEKLLSIFSNNWEKVKYKIKSKKNDLHEATYLKLDCSKAFSILEWKPVMTIQQSIMITLQWYKEFYEKKQVDSLEQLKKYIENANNQSVKWID